jgi:superfamily II DNA or RNA helicase
MSTTSVALAKSVKLPGCINDYLSSHGPELAAQIVQSLPPLHSIGDPISPLLGKLRREPYPAQVLAIMGIVKQWERSRSAAAVAECGTGKTLISLASVFVHSQSRPFTALAMAPPHLVDKWAREAFQTVPGVRVFAIDGLRTARPNAATGINEVKLRHGRIVREGLKTSLTELRLRKTYRSALQRWKALCGLPSLFVVGRERAKLSYFWKHAYNVAECGRYTGSIVNPDTGSPVCIGEDGERLIRSDFKKSKLAEWLGADTEEGGKGHGKHRRALYSPLWQADGTRIHRFAPADFIARYMPGFFDYAIADEVHELKGGDTAQGNALGSLAASAARILILTGTLLGGYADELFHILYRLDPRKMLQMGFEHGSGGVQYFTETYGLLEKVTTIEPADNKCSEACVTERVRRRPGASPLLFGHFLMDFAAFLSLEDISDALPPYREEVVAVEMDPVLKEAYEDLEKDVKQAFRDHRGNQSVLSTGINALLLYPDRPFELGPLCGWEYNPETERRERFVFAEPRDLDQNTVYGKERQLVDEIKSELEHGRKVQVYAVYTQKRDVTRRLESILSKEGIRVARLTADVKPELREAWYERQLRQGTQVVIAHPRLVALGLDLLSFPTLIFYETGYSIFTLRQASRRSWRIGQYRNVVVKYFAYKDTAQETCLRLMGRKLLVSLAMEGKFSAEGLQAVGDEDMLMAMARELVTEKGVGESASAIWRKLQKRHEESFGTRQEGEPEIASPVEPVAPSGPLPLVSQPLYAFGMPAAELVRKKSPRRVSTSENQLALFDP